MRLLSMSLKALRYGMSVGWCPICEKRTVFYKRGSWLRDDLRCLRCQSIPRFRGIIHVLQAYVPNWRDLHIHESSPGGASSAKILRECRRCTQTYYFPDTPPGTFKDGHRCEDLEKQTFPDETFDLIITQDVLEHILDPAAAFAEVARTLKPGGCHVFTLPWYYWKGTVLRAVRNGNEIRHLAEPEFHGNPIDPHGSLVVTEWGWDMSDFIYRASGMTTTVIRIVDRYRGIDGEFVEVFISRKPDNSRRGINKGVLAGSRAFFAQSGT